jgi:hypothetical protein
MGKNQVRGGGVASIVFQGGGLVTQKKPEFHLTKLTGDPEADARTVAKMYEALTGKKATLEEIQHMAENFRRPVVVSHLK